MDEPGDKYQSPSSAIGSATGPATATATAPAPTNVAANTTRHCGEYYAVQKGDDCDTIIQEFPISRANFLILNPGLNRNCTNLLSGVSYCVKPVGAMEDYPGAPGYMPPISKIPWDSLPDATYAPMVNPDIRPLAPGTIKNCQVLVDGRDLEFGFSSVSDCEAVQTFWNITAAEMLEWNPSLKTANRNSTTCSFSKEYRYCLGAGGGSGSGSSSASSPAVPPGSGSTATKTTTKSTTKTTATASTAMDSMSSTTSSSSVAPSPPQTNSIPDNCSDYAKAAKGDNCVDFAKDQGISPEQLYKWNTVLGEDGKECDTMFQTDSWYCIAVSSNS